MLSVDGGLYLIAAAPRHRRVPPREVPAFLIDRTEVTNAAYREFVGAGGYSNAEHWREPFERDGETVPTAEAMAAFRDSTGRPGPAAWVLGAPPDRTRELAGLGRELVRSGGVLPVAGHGAADPLSLDARSDTELGNLDAVHARPGRGLQLRRRRPGRGREPSRNRSLRRLRPRGQRSGVGVDGDRQPSAICSEAHGAIRSISSTR